MSHHVSAWPFGDWTRPRVAPLLEVADPNRLSPRPLWGDPPGSDRQTARVCHRAGLAHLGSHVSLPVRDPRAQLCARVSRSATRRIRSGHAPAARHDLDPADRRVVSGVRMVLPDGSIQPGPVVRHAAPRPLRPGRRDHRVCLLGRLRVVLRDPFVEDVTRIRGPRRSPLSGWRSRPYTRLTRPAAATLFLWPL